MRTCTGLTSLLLLFAVWGVSAQDRTPENGFPPGYFSGDPLPPSTIYLTFDDRPSPETEHILDILKDKGVRLAARPGAAVSDAALGSAAPRLTLIRPALGSP